MAKTDTPELTAYKSLRDATLARLAIPANAPGATSGELRELATRLLAVCDGQAGIASSAPALIHTPGEAAPMLFDDLLRRACLLSSVEWSSVAIPAELVRLANAVSAA